MLVVFDCLQDHAITFMNVNFSALTYLCIVRMLSLLDYKVLAVIENNASVNRMNYMLLNYCSELNHPPPRARYSSTTETSCCNLSDTASICTCRRFCSAVRMSVCIVGVGGVT